MARVDPADLNDDDDAGREPIGVEHRRDRDGVESLRDVEAEAGDDEGVTDEYDMDDREARSVGVELDDRDEPEPGLE